MSLILDAHELRPSGCHFRTPDPLCVSGYFLKSIKLPNLSVDRSLFVSYTSAHCCKEA